MLLDSLGVGNRSWLQVYGDENQLADRADENRRWVIPAYPVVGDAKRVADANWVDGLARWCG